MLGRVSKTASRISAISAPYTTTHTSPFARMRHAGRPASRFAVFRLARTASDCARIREVLQACDLIMPESRRGSEGSMARPLGTAARARSSRQSLGETTWFAPGQWLTHKNTITALRLTPVTHARVTRRVTPPAGYLGLPPPTLSTTATALVPSTLDGTLVRRVRPASDRRALNRIPSKSEPERVEPKDSHPRPRTGAGAHEREGERT